MPEDDLATRVVSTSDAAPQEPKTESDLHTRVLRPEKPGTAFPESPESDQGTRVGLASDWSSVQTNAIFSDTVPLCLMPGMLLGGRYEIQKSLGEGGMGAVYKARDCEVDRLVAIKIIRPELASDPNILQRFKQELVLARQVTHLNVVRIFDLGSADGLRFISMEYIEGRELNEVLSERGKFEPKEAASIMLQVANGLAAAHSQGVVHRDLKPQNIMLDGRGRAAVMDFGIASSIGAASDAGTSAAPDRPAVPGLTQFGSLLGTPRYMSPEQARRESVDARSDIFALGIIFYELLTGTVPFLATTVKEALNKRLRDPALPPNKLDPAIPKGVNKIVVKCLQPLPERRYQSASELVEDLEIWLGIRSSPNAHKIARWKMAAAGVALIAVTAAGLVVFERMTATKKPPATVKLLISDFKNATGDPVLNGTVEPMLQVALEGASFVTSFNRGEAHKLAAKITPGVTALDEHLGRLVAMREGVNVVVGGSVEPHRGGYRLSANAVDATSGKVLTSRTADFVQKNDLPKAVDDVAARIRRALGDSSSSSQASGAETFTSGSLASAQKYAEAQQFQWDGKWDEAMASWREATRLDPSMSRAYAGLAATAANLGNRRDAEYYYKMALAHIDRESDREKFRTRGGYYLMERDYQKAAEQYRQLVKLYPADSAGLANLALAYFYARNMPAALEQGKAALQIYPGNLLQRNNLGLYAMYAGDFDSAIKESQQIIDVNPSFAKAYLCLGLAELGRGSVGDAQKAYQKMATVSKWGSSEAALALGDLALYEGRFHDAIQQLGTGIKSDRERNNTSSSAVKLIALANAELDSGQKRLALADATSAVASSDDDSIVYGAAAIELAAGDKNAALALAKKLESRFGVEPQTLAKLIVGEVQSRGTDLHAAVATLQEAQKLGDTWLGRLDLGRAYLQAKLYPDAENEFDLCIKRRGEATAVFLDDEPTLRYLPAVYYYRGVAREGLLSNGAQEDYKAFLAIKQNSEPDQMVADAKRRLKKEETTK